MSANPRGSINPRIPHLSAQSNRPVWAAWLKGCPVYRLGEGRKHRDRDENTWRVLCGGIMKRTSRTPCKLSDLLHHRLNAYALAASAAGVSLLALADPAQAKIVYTPAGVTFGGTPCGSGSDVGNYSLDLNHDGIADFEFGWSGSGGSGCSSGRNDLVVQPTGSNGVAGSSNWAFRLRGGTLIGPQQSFSGGLMASFFSCPTECAPNSAVGRGFGSITAPAKPTAANRVIWA